MFSSDPAYPPLPQVYGTRSEWTKRSYILSSIPMRKPPTFIDNASAFISTSIAAPLSSFFTGESPTRATPDEVFSGGDIDLKEDEVLEEDRGEEGEVDDSPEPVRRVRVLSITDKVKEERVLGEKAKTRRRWEVISLRKTKQRTGS